MRSAESKEYLKGAAFVLAAAGLWSLGGAGVKLCGFGGWQLAGLRGGVAALAVLAMSPRARRGWTPQSLLVGFCAAGTTLFYVLSTKLTTAANAIFIQCTYPVWLLLLGPWLTKEKVRLRELAALLVFGAGLAMVYFAPEQATELSPDIAKGNLLALVSGLAFALSIMGIRLLREGGAETGVAMGNAMVFFLATGALLAGVGTGGEEFVRGTPLDWAVLVFLGVFQIGLAYVLYARGLRHIRAMQAGLIGLVEPVLNPVWVFLLFREEIPGPWAVAGGAVILAATAHQIMAGSRQAKAGGAAESAETPLPPREG